MFIRSCLNEKLIDSYNKILIALTLLLYSNSIFILICLFSVEFYCYFFFSFSIRVQNTLKHRPIDLIRCIGFATNSMCSYILHNLLVFLLVVTASYISSSSFTTSLPFTFGRGDESIHVLWVHVTVVTIVAGCYASLSASTVEKPIHRSIFFFVIRIFVYFFFSFLLMVTLGESSLFL